MKKVIALLLTAVLLLGCTGCKRETKAISCDDVIAAYEDAGYTIFHKETAAEDYTYSCYVQATHPETGEYIMFHFFNSPEAAESYADTRQWNLVLWLYSAASGQPTWLATETYNNIEIEYDNGDLYKPFQTLLK